MGNYFPLRPVVCGVMAVRDTPVGIAHPTVVPENFEHEELDQAEATSEDA